MIIDQIAATEQPREDLFACMLTCKQFVHPSRKHVFRHLSLSFGSNSDRLSTVYHPNRLGQYVRSLSINGPNVERRFASFQSLLSRLRNISSLTLRNINWDVFNVTLSRAIVDLTRQRESIARKKAQAAAHPEDQSSHEPPNFYSRVVEANPYKPNVKARTS